MKVKCNQKGCDITDCNHHDNHEQKIDCHVSCAGHICVESLPCGCATLEHCAMSSTCSGPNPDNQKSQENKGSEMTGRGVEWHQFAQKVLTHIDKYTVPQYGDIGDDQLTNYTAEDCIKQAQKYCNRFGRNQREGQQELDLMKAAHYICVAHAKLTEVMP